MTGSSVDRSRLPDPKPTRTFPFPAIEKSTLPNGLRVWTVHHTQVPLVAFTLLMRRGAAADPPGQEGLAAVTADMLDEGSGDRSAIEMHEALARLGAQFDTDIGSDATVASVTVLSRFAQQALALLSDIVVRPALREHDFARVRQLRLHRLTQLRDMPGAVADRAFLRLVYGAHPYGHSPMGNETSLAAMNVDDARGFHARAIRPSVATLIAVGDCEHEAIVRLAADAFSDWNGASDGEVAPGGALPHAARLNVVPRPRAPQSELRIGQVAAGRDSPDYHALVLANTILGGQFVSRINLNLREDKGLTYGARTAFEFRRLSGPFVLQVSVQTSGTATAISESIGEIFRHPRAAPGHPRRARARHRGADARLRAQLRDRRADRARRPAARALRPAGRLFRAVRPEDRAHHQRRGVARDGTPPRSRPHDDAHRRRSRRHRPGSRRPRPRRTGRPLR